MYLCIFMYFFSNYTLWKRCAYALVRFRPKNHLVSVQKASSLGLKYLFWLEMSWGIIRNTQFCHHKYWLVLFYFGPGHHKFTVHLLKQLRCGVRKSISHIWVSWRFMSSWIVGNVVSGVFIAWPKYIFCLYCFNFDKSMSLPKLHGLSMARRLRYRFVTVPPDLMSILKCAWLFLFQICFFSPYPYIPYGVAFLWHLYPLESTFCLVIIKCYTDIELLIIEHRLLYISQEDKC